MKALDDLINDYNDLVLRFNCNSFYNPSFFCLLGLNRITELPWGTDSVLVSVFSSVRTFTDIFPPLVPLMQVFLLMLSFEITMLLLRTFRIIR